MPARVSPTEAVRAEIDELFGSGRDIAEVLEEVMRLSARLVLQQVLEDEVTSWLGRDWNSRAEGGRAGQRNGYGDLTVKTHRGARGAEAPEAAQHRRGVRVGAVGQGGRAHRAAGGAGHLGVGARPVRSRHRDPVGGGAGPRGRPVEVHRQPDLRPAARRVRRLPAAETSPASSWTTCSLTGRTSRCTTDRGAEPVLVAYGITKIVTDVRPPATLAEGRTPP